MTSKVIGQGRKVTWYVGQVLAHTLKTKCLKKTQIDRKVAHPTQDIAYKFQGQMVKRQHNAGRAGALQFS